VEFPNVVYEIMNEPTHTYSDARNPAKRARWADAIVGAIYLHTKGKRFIFYNDHTSLSSWPGRGQDIIFWGQPNNGTKNFSKLDGVIFHGNVEKVNPEAFGWTFAQKLIIQVSTDGYTGQDRDYHRRTTVNAFQHGLMFQAEAVDDPDAAAGIGSAVPAPTLFKLPPFVGTWVKTGETPTTNFPHLIITQNADAGMVVMNPDTDLIVQQGRVVQLYANKIGFWNETLQRVGVQEYAFTNNSQTLTLKRADGGTQTFQKYAGPLAPFLYQWSLYRTLRPRRPSPSSSSSTPTARCGRAAPATSMSLTTRASPPSRRSPNRYTSTATPSTTIPSGTTASPPTGGS
jgi:hypothetical protein